MFLFAQSDTPAVRTHLNAQLAFLNDMSKSFSRSFQEMCKLNIQLGQTLLEESTIIGHQLLTTERPGDMMSMTAARAQPATEKLRAYQQHISRAAADSQVEIAKVAEHHVQETSRTARALADQVARTASEQTDRSVRQQEETLKNFRDPFEQGNAQGPDGSAYRGSMQSAGEGASGGVQVDVDSQQGSLKGSAQGSQASDASQQLKPAKSS